MISRRRFIANTGLSVIGLAGAGLTVAPLYAQLIEKLGQNSPGSKATIDHSAWDALVSAYVVESPDGINRVRYGVMQQEAADALDAYLRDLQSADIRKINATEQQVYWYNLYNALTVKVILDNYPIKSIRKLGGVFAGGPWKEKIARVLDEEISLDDIEHGLLRPIYRDPRTHYAVNCASIGCPNLQTAAFTSANMEELLDKGAVDYVNHPRGATVNGKSVKVSSIYSWFKKDFGSSDANIIAHLRLYARGNQKARLEGATSISGHSYDWDLNDA